MSDDTGNESTRLLIDQAISQERSRIREGIERVKARVSRPEYYLDPETADWCAEHISFELDEALKEVGE